MTSQTKRSMFNITSWAVVVSLVFITLNVVVSPQVRAATSGQIKLYLHATNSDANETYNSMDFSPPITAADNADATTSTVTFSSAAPALCEDSNNTSDKFTRVAASGTATGEKCMGSFISPKLGKSISFNTGDSASITGQFYFQESASAETITPNIYVYRWTGSGNPATTDRLATLTCADPGTTATSCVPTAAAPAQNVTANAGDRIVAIITMNLTAGNNTGRTMSTYLDSNNAGTRNDIELTLGYSAFAYNNTNAPASFGGSLDDDFTTGANTTTCTTGGVTYHTKWTCLLGTASSISGKFNAADTNTPPTNGDTSGWLWLTDQTTATTATVSNFGTTPSNNFIYQTLPGDYGSGDVTTVVNVPSFYELGATPTTSSSPWNHMGLVLWTSNTDYLELQVYADGAGGGTNTAHVAINNSGTISNAQNLNSTTTTGTYSTIWLRFSNTNGTWQPKYSTDGASFTNVGSTIGPHNAFKRVGLNAFTDIANPVSTMSGAFEWFQSTLAAGTYNQDSYIWDANANSTTPGAHLAAHDTTYTLTSTSQAFRLRLDLQITGQSNAANTPPSFKLQYVGKGSGTCASPSGGNPSTYTDVTSSTLIAYNDNSTPADNANISTTASDDPVGAGTNVAETYEEANNFSAIQNDLNNSNDGLWDFSLIDNGGGSGITYCFKAVTSGGSDITTYTNRPEITTFTVVGPTTDQVLRGGEWFNGGSKQPFFWAN